MNDLTLPDILNSSELFQILLIMLTFGFQEGLVSRMALDQLETLLFYALQENLPKQVLKQNM